MYQEPKNQGNWHFSLSSLSPFLSPLSSLCPLSPLSSPSLSPASFSLPPSYILNLLTLVVKETPKSSPCPHSSSPQPSSRLQSFSSRKFSFQCITLQTGLPKLSRPAELSTNIPAWHSSMSEIWPDSTFSLLTHVFISFILFPSSSRACGFACCRFKRVT